VELIARVVFTYTPAEHLHFGRAARDLTLIAAVDKAGPPRSEQQVPKDDLKTAIRFYRERGYEECPRYNENPQATVFLRRKMQVSRAEP
jgi:hypothetical protein